jgi:hypothetical protein
VKEKYLDNRRYVYQKEGGKRSCKKEPRKVHRENVVQKCADVLKTVQVSQFKVPKITVFSLEREEIIKLAPWAISEEKTFRGFFCPAASHRILHL